ncbi:DNA topology modulation protein FlaR [Paracoccus siganidrum]|uniref:DNA topology modulation protein FlaR n=1 Tax=Paracoccus siganidrum TaxID=1276757 RepID=UPI00160525F5|nr:DNA topology modulation protein FlaR [Paracoccus siganidrum]
MGGVIQRVMIVGGPGSGKSFVATRLGALSGLPVHHMDHIHWLPGWVERERLEKDMLTREIHAKPRWIFEGGHSRTYRERAARADLLIWLDLPVGLRIRRVLWRSLRHLGRRRPDMAEGCPELLGRQTVDFLRFIWRTRETSRQAVRRVISPPPDGLRVVHLTRPAAVRGFLSGCRGAPGGGGLLAPAAVIAERPTEAGGHGGTCDYRGLR